MKEIIAKRFQGNLGANDTQGAGLGSLLQNLQPNGIGISSLEEP